MEISNVILGTGCYDNVKSGNTVSVASDGGYSYGFFGSSYKKLAPKLEKYVSYNEKYKELLRLKEDLSNIDKYLEYKKINEDEYIKRYYDIRLRNLDIEKLFYSLNKKFGNNIILLCYESVDEFCHRRLIADYIEIETGIYIPEVSVDECGNVKKLVPIRYKNRLKKVIEDY